MSSKGILSLIVVAVIAVGLFMAAYTVDEEEIIKQRLQDLGYM